MAPLSELVVQDVAPDAVDPLPEYLRPHHSTFGETWLGSVRLPASTVPFS